MVIVGEFSKSSTISHPSVTSPLAAAVIANSADARKVKIFFIMIKFRLLILGYLMNLSVFPSTLIVYMPWGRAAMSIVSCCAVPLIITVPLPRLTIL